MNQPTSTRGSYRRVFAGDLVAVVLAAAALGIAVWGNDPGRWEAAVREAGELLNRARIYFSGATQNSSLAAMFYPAVAMAFFALTLRLLFKRPPDWMRLPVGIVFLALQITYL